MIHTSKLYPIGRTTIRVTIEGGIFSRRHHREDYRPSFELLFWALTRIRLRSAPRDLFGFRRLRRCHYGQRVDRPLLLHWHLPGEPLINKTRNSRDKWLLAFTSDLGTSKNALPLNTCPSVRCRLIYTIAGHVRAYTCRR